MQTPPNVPLEQFAADLKAFIAAVLVFGAVVTFISACGGDDLVFPGMGAPTSPPANTATPEPTEDI